MRDEDRIWSMIDSAWARLGPTAAADRALLVRRTPNPDEDPDYVDIERRLGPLLDLLRDDCASLPDAELSNLDQALERVLAQLDRPDIHDVVEGSYDGFLYRRGFIVALGRDFYTAVLADPEMAVYEAECGDLCFLFAGVRDQRLAG